MFNTAHKPSERTVPIILVVTHGKRNVLSQTKTGFVLSQVMYMVGKLGKLSRSWSRRIII